MRNETPKAERQTVIREILAGNTYSKQHDVVRAISASSVS
jgi:arginine repressor